MERDKNIDKYRALIMAYIVCVIHGVYWLGFGKEPWRSLILFEMPIIFFISGAAHLLSKPKPYLTFVKSKIKRVVIPYYIWVLVSIPLSIALLMVKSGEINVIGGGNLILKGLMKLAVFRSSRGLIPMDKHLWFIVPFLIVMLIAPFASRILTTKRRIIIACISLAMVTLLGDYIILKVGFDNMLMDMVNYICVYEIFFILGFLYKRIKASNSILIGGLILILLSGVLIYSGLYPQSMQDNKFPPTIVFLLYNIGVLAVLCYVFSRIRIPDWKWLDDFNKRGFTIYMYQNWVIYIYAMLILYPLRHLCIVPGWMLFIVTVITLFFMHWFVSKFTYKYETRITERIMK